jgi:chromate transporter
MARIGATAFGGGSATIVALRQVCLRRGWLEESGFLDTVVLSRVTPGITILAQVILIGRAVAGWVGVAAAVLGLLLPSITITTALAVAYRAVSDQSWAARPLELVASVAAGFAVALAVQLLRDTLPRRGPRAGLTRDAVLFTAYVVLGLLLPLPEVVLVASLLAGLAVPRLFLHAENLGEDLHEEFPDAS